MTQETTGQSVAKTLLEGVVMDGVCTEMSMTVVASASCFKVISLTLSPKPVPAS